MSRFTLSVCVFLTAGVGPAAWAADKPVRVLLMAGSPTRDYQFTRTLFAREMEKNRAELSIYLPDRRPGVVADVPSERMLSDFPTRFAAEDKKEEDRLNNLASYDLIVAYDFDWLKLKPEQLALVSKWVEQGGGLIVVGGPINTYQLARKAHAEKLKPILDLLPVQPKDHRIEADRDTRDAYPLNFSGAAADMTFLRLEEDKKADLLDGWKKFFGKVEKNDKGNSVAERGFYTYYPVKCVKSGAVVVAAFTDPSAKMDDGALQPYLVTAASGKGKAVWLGSGETWRLRAYRESYHERFWTGLARYAAGRK